MNKKVIISIVLLVIAGVIMAVWLSGKSPRYGAVNDAALDDADAAGALEFAAAMVDLAHKGNQRQFAGASDRDNADLAVHYQTMRKVRTAAPSEWTVKKVGDGSDVYFVMVKAQRGEGYTCVVKKNSGEWSFVGLYDE